VTEERVKIEAVLFDVGETIVDETREYGTWADWLGVPRHTFSAVFGAVIAQGGDYRETFQYFRPGFDLQAERERTAGRTQPVAAHALGFVAWTHAVSTAGSSCPACPAPSGQRPALAVDRRS
jgi:hypothetical protein